MLPGGTARVTDRGRGVHRHSTPGSSSENINGEDGNMQGQTLKNHLSSTPSHLSSTSSRQGQGRRPRGMFDEDLHNNTSGSLFGGRPGSADFSLNTSSSNSPVSCRDERQPRSASLSSDDVVGLSQSQQQTMSRSSTLQYEHAPQRAQPQRGGTIWNKNRSSSPGSEMVTLEEFLQESNLQSPPVVSTGSREDLMSDYFTRSPTHSAPGRDQVTPTSYVTPTVHSSNQRPGQSVKPLPRQPVGQSPASAQRGSQSLSRAFSLASADLLHSNGPDGFRSNEASQGHADVVTVRRQGGGSNARERPLSARFPAPDGGGGSTLSQVIHHSASLNLQMERYAERDRDRGRTATLAAPSSRTAPHHHRGEVAMVTPVRATPLEAPEHAEATREGRMGEKKDGERGECSSTEHPKSTPASPDPASDSQTVWYEYGCV